MLSLFRKVKCLITKKYYCVGILSDVVNPYCTNTAHDVHWIKYPNYKRDWLADPFLLSEDENSISFLAEQWIETKGKGQIVKVVISKPNYIVEKISVILELDTHLSYPNIYRENDVIYVYPENYQSGVFSIYRYNPKTEKLENPIPLIKAPLLDAQIVKLNDRYYILSIGYEGIREENQKLYIYQADTLLGPYELIQTIDDNKLYQRGAGQIIVHKKDVIRPTQDCEEDYGKAVIFQKISCNQQYLNEEIVGRLMPSKEYPEGLHTYNVMGRICIIDGIKYSIGNIMTYIKTIIK